VSIAKRYKNLDSSNKFLILFPLWLIVLFGLFYWGNYYSLCPIGKVIDSAQRGVIMPILDTVLSNPIVNYDIVINPKYRIVITPECNGIIPFLMILAAIIAYSCQKKRKIIWAVLSYFVISIVNLIRLILVVKIVDIFGVDSFHLVHDIGGNILLILTGSGLFLLYIRGCFVIENGKWRIENWELKVIYFWFLEVRL